MNSRIVGGMTRDICGIGKYDDDQHEINMDRQKSWTDFVVFENFVCVFHCRWATPENTTLENNKRDNPKYMTGINSAKIFNLGKENQTD